MAEELSLSFSRGMYHSPGVYFFKIIYQRWVQRFLLQIWHWLSILLTCWLISISKWGDIFSLSYAVWYRDGLIWSNWSGLKSSIYDLRVPTSKCQNWRELANFSLLVFDYVKCFLFLFFLMYDYLYLVFHMLNAFL